MSNLSQQSKPASKNHGRIYTPCYLVKIILDYVGYQADILTKHIIDNSCGDGAFLVEIVDRYCTSFLSHSHDLNALKLDLQTYIHGIELDEFEYRKCLFNLNKTIQKYKIDNIDWDILCSDSLSVNSYNQKMDYVVGNPPYVRVHNLELSYENVKKFTFSQGGMTDLFIVFFEIGFNMLSSTGKMCIITPSSWLSSKAGLVLRNYIIHSHNFSGAIDLGHYQAFQATTYTLISRFDKSINQFIDYNTFDGSLHCLGKLLYSDFIIGKEFYLSLPDGLARLKQIKMSKIPSLVKVKNGFATLADKIFIGDFVFNEITIDIIKASTGRWQKCIFPYNAKGKPLLEESIANYEVYKYLSKYKDELTKNRDLERENDWFLFGRTQAINDVYKDKISINSIIKDKESIKIHQVPSGKGVYSGLYILSPIPFDVIKKIIVSDDFINYLKLLKNYKSGGYYTFTSKDLELFINYQLQIQQYGQQSISSSDNTLF